MISRWVCVLCIALSAAPAWADVFKCVDDRGRITYTNDKPTPAQKGCTLLSKDMVSTVPMRRAPPSASTPSDFPRVDETTQKNRDNDRRKILEQELGSEQQQLDDAKKALQLGEAERSGAERNDAKYQERLQTLRDSVRAHETNIEKLRKEISNLK